MEYIVSECWDGRFVLQRPNGFGGLYSVIGPSWDCRNTAEVLQVIHDDLEVMDVTVIWSEGIKVEFRGMFDPKNRFTAE